MNTCDEKHGPNKVCKDPKCYLLPIPAPVPAPQPTVEVPVEVPPEAPDEPAAPEPTPATKLEPIELVAKIMQQNQAPVKFAQDVVDFHKKFDIQYDGVPRMLPAGLKYFRHQRNVEEDREWYHAQDTTESLDAIIDKMYILLGNAHLCGFTPAMIEEGWRRVHKKNMEKELSSPENPGKYSAVGTDIVKPRGWTPPDLRDIVEVAK